MWTKLSEIYLFKNQVKMQSEGQVDDIESPAVRSGVNREISLKQVNVEGWQESRSSSQIQC